jgi:hypothetical protein
MKSLFRRTLVGSIGPITSEALEAHGLRVDVTAGKSTLEALLDAIEGGFAASLESVLRSPVSSAPSWLAAPPPGGWPAWTVQLTRRGPGGDPVLRSTTASEEVSLGFLADSTLPPTRSQARPIP